MLIQLTVAISPPQSEHLVGKTMANVLSTSCRRKAGKRGAEETGALGSKWGGFGVPAKVTRLRRSGEAPGAPGTHSELRLEKPLFLLLLAFDAVTSPGYRLETLGLHFLAARDAEPV